MVINAFYTMRNIIEWHVAVNAVLVMSSCILLKVRGCPGSIALVHHYTDMISL